MRSTSAIGAPTPLWPWDSPSRCPRFCPPGSGRRGRPTEAPPPHSVSEVSTPLDSTFRESLLSPGHIRATGALKESLEGLPAFLRDTNLTLNPRTYYFDESDSSGEIKEAWALGDPSNSIRLGMGPGVGGCRVFRLGPLYTGPNAGDTLLLTSTGSSYTVLGQAYLAANLSKTAQLIAGRTAAVLDTPYANREFNRMTPNTFQGALLNGLIADEQQAHSLHYLVGYLDKIKERNSADFIPCPGRRAAT